MKLDFDTGLLWKKSKHWLFIAAVLVLAIYPLSFFQFIPKWDSVRGYLPYRFFVSDYIMDGHLPFWNPFQRLGYPGYSDLQSGCWYPILWLLMLLGQYDITSLILEVVLCFVISGWGMFTLSRWMHGCNRTATVLAISYGLSGFMVGSTQLMVFLIGIAWLPWIVWAWLRILNGGGARYAALLSFFLVCNITGASPAFTIVLLYLLPAIAIYYFARSNEKASFLRQFIFNALISVTFLLLLLAPFIVAFVDFLPYFNRSGKMPYEAIILNPFVWSDYLSFLFPYSVLSTHSMFQITDLSLRNAYIGIAGLLFFGATLISSKYRSKWFWGILVSLVLSMWLAMGDESGVYRQVYHLPGFGLFRHPAFFRGYGIMCMLLLAGFSMRQWLNGEAVLNKRFVLIFTGMFLVVACAAWLSTESGMVLKTVEEIARAGEFPSHGFTSQLFVSSAVTLSLIVLMLAVKRIFMLSRFAALLLFVVLDLMVQTRLTAPTTIYHAVTYAETKSYFDSLEQLPSHDQTGNSTALKLLDETQGLRTSPALVTNVSTFNRRVSAVGENPLRFRTFDQAKDSGMLAWVLENPLMYFPYRVCLDGDSIGAGCIFRMPVHLDNVGREGQLENVQVDYNAYRASVNNPTEYSRWLVLNANYHHLWTAKLNGEVLPIERVNHMAMGVLIPAQTAGVVEFQFDSPAIRWAIALVLLGLIALVVVLMRTGKASSSEVAG